MRDPRPFAALIAFVVLTCRPINYPAPSTPVLQRVELAGARTCGGAAMCLPALPTPLKTSWQLDPQTVVAPNGRVTANVFAKLVVDTPNLTDLQVFALRSDRVPLPLEQLDGTTRPKAFQYLVTPEDRGTTTRWYVTVATRPQVQTTVFSLVNVGRGTGAPRSAPLEVEIVTAIGPLDLSKAPVGGPVVLEAVSRPGAEAGSGTPQTPTGCTMRTFRFCESCNAFTDYYELSACSWEEVRRLWGYVGNPAQKPGCVIREVTQRSDCN